MWCAGAARFARDAAALAPTEPTEESLLQINIILIFFEIVVMINFYINVGYPEITEVYSNHR